MNRTAALTLALFLAACGGKSTPPPTAPLPDETAKTDEPPPPAEEEQAPPAPEPPKPEPVTVTLPAPAVDIKLTKPGKGKKAQLVYVLPVGPVGGVELQVGGDFELPGFMPKQTLPTMTLDYTTEVLEVAADGGIKLRHTLAGANADGVSPAGEDPKAQLEPMVGTTLETTLSKQGVPGERTFKTPPIDDPAKVGSLTQLPPMTVPVPDKAVGTGATWEVTEPLGYEGIEATVKTVYTLKSRKGKTATIVGTSTIEGGKQTQTGGEDPVEIESIKGTATSTYVLEEGRVIGSSDVAQHIEITIAQPQPMTMVMNTSLKAKAK